MIIAFKVHRDGVPIVYSDVVLEDPTAAYGMRNKDDLSVVLAAGAVLVADGSGGWTYTFTPTDGIDYEWYVKATEDTVDSYFYDAHDGSTGSAITITSRYTSVDLVNRRFGADVVNKWCQVNGADADDILVHQSVAITTAEDYIDAVLRDGIYDVPFTGTIPSMITNIATMLAGVNMYEAKGVLDWSPDTGQPQHRLHFQRAQAMDLLNNIRIGRVKLTTAPAATTIMEVATD